MKKEFVNIKAAFAVDDAFPGVIHLYCDNPGFTYAQLKNNVITTIGMLRDNIVEWLKSDSKEPLCIGNPTLIKYIKVEAPAAKTYNIQYGSVHHIDER